MLVIANVYLTLLLRPGKARAALLPDAATRSAWP